MTFSWTNLNSYYSGDVKLQFWAHGPPFEIDMKAQTSYTKSTFPGDPSGGGDWGVWNLHIVAEGPSPGTSLPIVSTHGFNKGGFQAIVHAPGNTLADTTLVWFEYGTSVCYGMSTTPQKVAAGVSINFSEYFDFGSVPPNTRLHFRVVAQNDSGTFYGEDMFISNGTPPPEPVFINYTLIENRWNLVSVPVTMSDYRKTEVFPTSTTSAYAYQNGYIEKDTLRKGIGYWLKFGESQVILWNNDCISTTESLDVVEGWNLIGSINSPLLVSNIISDPPGLVTSNFYGYKNGYFTSDTILPGEGYWVKVTQNGKIVLLSLPEEIVAANRIQIIPTSELPPPPPGDFTSDHLRLPSEFSLKQNYPNPFNPNTIISFELPQNALVTVKIFNILGQEIATLVNKKEFALGIKQLEFNGANLTSGVYYYKIIAEDLEGNGILYSNTKRMTLVK